jgi:hypothetical protein
VRSPNGGSSERLGQLEALAEVRSLRSEAEREAQLAAERLARVRRDYQDDKLAAEDWAEQREQLAGERTAADAEAERLRASGGEVEQGISLFDAEQETLARLTEIRRAIAGEVQDAASTDSVRAALARLFVCFIVHRSTPERAHVELIGETWIEPVIREQVIEGYTETMRPILRRTSLDRAENNYAVGLPIHYSECEGHPTASKTATGSR